MNENICQNNKENNDFSNKIKKNYFDIKELWRIDWSYEILANKSDMYGTVICVCQKKKH